MVAHRHNGSSCFDICGVTTISDWPLIYSGHALMLLLLLLLLCNVPVAGLRDPRLRS
jgi:hypothetical protein